MGEDKKNQSEGDKLFSIVSSLTTKVRETLSGKSISTQEYVKTYTTVESLILELRLTKNNLSKSVITRTALEYRKLRYEADNLAGHQEATKLIKGDETIVDTEKKIDDLDAYINHLRSLIELMLTFEKMTRY